MVLLDYQALQENSQPRQEHSILIPFILKIGAACLMSQLLIYIYFFVHLYKYNNGLQILTREKKKSRIKTNVQTLLGQFVLFVIVSVYIVFMSLAFAPEITGISPDTKDLGVVVKTLEFGLFSLIHCFLIPELRGCFKKLWPKPFKCIKLQ
jgi:hypothetical protein